MHADSRPAREVEDREPDPARLGGHRQTAGPGNVRANDALNAPVSPSAMTPCEFGPTSRTLCARLSTSRSRPAAAWPGPENPDDTTTAAPPRPAWQASVITSSTWSAGTTTTTRSTGSGTSVTDAYAVTPATSLPSASASGCTTQIRPSYPPDLMASRIARPSPLP